METRPRLLTLARAAAARRLFRTIRVLAVAGGSSVRSAGPGSGLSEEPMTGVRSVALDFRDAPECPPGSALASAS
jgi:hypothetical protein